MKWKRFFKPTIGKILLLIPIFILLFIYGAPMCLDPSEEGWTKTPDPEYWGCHSQWHRQFHFIPDWPSEGGLGIFLFVLISYLISCLIVWIYNKVKKK